VKSTIAKPLIVFRNLPVYTTIILSGNIYLFSRGNISVFHLLDFLHDGDWLRYLSTRFTRAFCACFESRWRIEGAGFERFSQPQLWLPQGLAAATVPGAILMELLWLTVNLSNLTSYATAIFPQGKIDSHGRAHILAANVGFAF